ncbi:extracellular solute-binding protein [Nonomuraea sp. MG754425]|uniref:ABC transporter substrate-binding protein n=1 Tax=Nonomuraea sp. MG754425 TaxID=2570319 RepID=UPI001F488C66|nr:extracellular solute-binding protein [Nonomuraea sp. MG754425]MCF6472739.1 extracellular solute-binding protein [Nonomuraea sp. MG754425]
MKLTAGLLGCAVLATTLTACGSPAADEPGVVVIRVQGMPPATDKPGLDQFKKMVADFEKQHPGIEVQGSTTTFDPLTFSAKLAGGRVEDVIKVPLTEPQGLIARKQVRPLTEELSAWAHYKEFNPQVLRPLSDTAGQVYGVPQSPFAQGLVYNRALFAEAGLDPDQPPKTWDEVRAAAKAISGKTGKAGFVHESKSNQGGWQLTMLTYTHGGEIERQEGGKHVAAFNADPMKKALGLLKEMRWSDDSMGDAQLNDQNDVIKRFAAGEIGMFMGTPGTYRLAKMTYGMQDTDAFGVGPLPQAGGNATMTGGDVYLVPRSVSEERAAAAVKWLLFAYAQPQYDPAAAASRAKDLAADPKSAVGVPTLPMFDAAQQAKIDAAIEPHVNVKLEHFRPWLEGTQALTLRPEPSVQAQQVYAVLDTVVQAVLTDKGAAIDELLAEAESDVNAKLAAARQ